MRGALPLDATRYMGIGIIPADAGSTSQLLIIHSTVQDHPRGCGEHLESALDVTAEAGSSPRMRGAPVVRCPIGGDDRIIPADAGSTEKVS